MPPGVPNIKQLDKLVSAALLQALSNAPNSPSSSSGGLSFLSDPKFLNALNMGTGLPAPGGGSSTGRQSSTLLPRNTSDLELSVNKMGFQQPHHSLLGKIFDVAERPFSGIAGFIHGGGRKGR
jgi:hypothetical protein